MVEVRESAKPSRFGDITGEVLKIIKRKKLKFVGTFYKENNILLVSPDSKRIKAGNIRM